MMPAWILLSVLVSAALFVLPFHRAKAGYVPSQRPRSLLAVLRREARWSATTSAKASLLRVGFFASLLVVFLPPAVLWQLSMLGGDNDGWSRVAIVIQSLALLPGCAMTILAMIISDMTIGFGSPVRTTVNTPVFWMIPIYEIGFAVGGVVAVFVV